MAKDIKRKIEETEPEEEILFTSLRVSDWTGFLGQKQVKESLKIAITAAAKIKK